MTTLKGPGEAKVYDGSQLRIGIVHARWNAKIIDALVQGALKSLAGAGVTAENMVIQSVPGSYELPYAVQRMYAASQATRAPLDAIIAVGALIKGATMHFEYISDAVSHGLMRVQLDTGAPVVFGLLTLLTEEQGLERAGLDAAGRGHNHGEDWGAAAVELGVKRKGWAEGVFVP